MPSTGLLGGQAASPSAAGLAEQGGRPPRRRRSDGGGRNGDGGPEAAEQLAREALAAGNAGLEAAQRVLEQIEVPYGKHRRNVIPVGQTEVRGMLLGLYRYGGSFGVTAATQKHPWLTRLLVALIRERHPDFPFTGIQVNHNYASRPHVDANNLGCSCIVAFGGFEGGELWVHDEDASGGVPHTLDPAGEDVSGRYLAGETFRGRVESVNGQWVQFDGNQLHFTLPFTGNRYSLVYFTCDQFQKAPEKVRCQLDAAGFGFDWTFGGAELAEALRRKLEARAEQRRRLQRERDEEAAWERLRRGRCAARIWANGWGQQCTAARAEGDTELCAQHAKGDRWRTHGLFDGSLPPAKREEMARTQQKWLRQGKLPPADEPWTRLVELPNAL